MHDCFTIELTGECLKCLFRLTGGVPAVVVQSEALWARIPEIQVRIPSRAMGTFFPHTVSSIFRLSLRHTHTFMRACASCRDSKVNFFLQILMRIFYIPVEQHKRRLS